MNDAYYKTRGADQAALTRRPALPLKPDPEWVKTLKVGDPVRVALDGQLWWDQVEVLNRTPTGRVRVGFPNGRPRGGLEFRANGFHGPRYLVAPETP